VRCLIALGLAGLLLLAADQANGEGCLKPDLDRMWEVREFQKRPLKDWIQDLQSMQVQTRRNAAYALGRLGAQDTVPALARATQDMDKDVQIAAIQALEQIGHKFWYGRDQTVWFQGVELLNKESREQWQKFAQEAVPFLRINLLATDKETRAAAVRALGNMMPQFQVAVLALVDMLQDPDLPIRIEAASSISRYSSKGKAAVPALLQCLHDKESAARAAAAQALIHVAPPTKAVTAALRQALRDPEARVRRYAADALRALGPAALDAAPDLTKAIREEDKAVRWSASRALAHIGPAGLTALIEALRDPSRNVRWESAHTLGTMGPKAKTAVPALIEGLKDADDGVRCGVVNALGEIGPDAKEAVPGLVKVLRQGPYGSLRVYAARSLAQIGPAAKQAVPALIDALRENDSELIGAMPTGRGSGVQAEAARALGFIGPAAKKAVPALIQATKKEDYSVSAMAILSLGSIGDPQAVPALAEKLKDKDRRFLEPAAMALERLGAQVKDAVPTLMTVYGAFQLQKPANYADYQALNAVSKALKKIAPEVAKKAGIP